MKSISIPIKKKIIEYARRNRQYKDFKKSFEDYKKEVAEEIKEYIEDNDLQEVKFNHTKEFQTTSYFVKLVKSRKVIFDFKKMKKVMSKELFREVATPDVKINDLDKFISIMKEYGVDYRDVKNLLDIDYIVDKDRLDDLNQLGLVSEKQIRSFTTSKTISSFLRIDKEKYDS